jgi:GNAT superfamily N-acetyltransferase
VAESVSRTHRSVRGVVVRPFVPADQEAARSVILAGMREHWGDRFDERLNPDLDDIGASYAGDTFLVAEWDGIVAGTGCLVVDGTTAASIVRMSTLAAFRRRGAGTKILAALVAHAQSLGVRRIRIATNADWQDAVAFYRGCGCRELPRADGAACVEFEIDL